MKEVLYMTELQLMAAQLGAEAMAKSQRGELLTQAEGRIVVRTLTPVAIAEDAPSSIRVQCAKARAASCGLLCAAG
jgi:hypothetical protein